MISSAVRSMSETKSLKALLSIFTAGRLLAARSIMSPARRAALTAVLRAGFIFLRFGWWGQAAAGRLPENGKAVRKWQPMFGAALYLGRQMGKSARALNRQRRPYLIGMREFACLV